MDRRKKLTKWLIAAFCTAAAATPLVALVVPEDTPVAEKAFLHTDLQIRTALELPGALPGKAASLQKDLEALGVTQAWVDSKSGRWGTLILAEPLLPGRGVGNQLTWDALKLAVPADVAGLEKAAWNAFTGYLARHKEQLRIDTGELVPGKVAVHQDGGMVQIHGERTFAGLRVKDSYVTAVVKEGNLILFGAHNWADVKVPTEPDVPLDDAIVKVQAFLDPYSVTGYWGKPELMIVPAVRNLAGDKKAGFATGFYHRLAWVVRPQVDGGLARWEVTLDAHDGKVLAFQDTNHYVASTRAVKGGVYPETNDGSGPEGTEQAGWPMPFSDVTNAVCGDGICQPNAGENCTNCAADCNGQQGGNPGGRFCCGDGGGQNPVDCSDSRCGGASACADAFAAVTDAGGNLLTCVDGTITSKLGSQFMRMNDNCGPISLSSTGDIDFGTSGGIDCTTPGFGGAGNTHASRSGFYEMNRIKEMARGQLPGNSWLQEQLLSNMNINNTCNAFWNGTSVNFYRSGGGCNNTGEIAGVYDHEWGHGMDDNDVQGAISNPGEGIADVYAALRLNTSCIGRGFRLGTACGGYGDPCVGTPPCDGVRDIDWANKASGQPHDVTWADGACGAGGSTPCGGSTHCEGHVYSESVWDLVHRDLPGDLNTNLEIGTRLTYLGAGLVGNWFQCVQGSGGCPANSGYMNFLAADDDNGNLADGTPHMTAIFNAFNRHGIACATPTVQNSNCGAPASAPAVTGTAVDRGADLSWSAVAGATSYEVFRTDGVFGCDFGKIKVGETTGTSFVDGGLQNGRDYFYTVIPKGAADSCFGPASACTTVTPVAGPNFALGAGTLSIGAAGDGDGFVDNCETGTWSFDVTNIGLGTQTNVRIASVTSSNPGVTIVTSLPAPISPSLAQCGIASGSFDFTAGGLSFDETVTFTVGVTSDALSPAVKTVVFTVNFAESDFQRAASRTYTFEAGTEGWTTIEGTFNRTNAGGGAQSTTWYEASSANLPDQCDHIRGPVIGLTSTSTMTVWNQFDIEPFFNQGGVWYDRANVGIYNPADSSRNPVSPDSGRTYNASGPNGTCGTTDQAGWGGAATSWASSGWSASALGGGAIAGVPVQLDVRYGTDPAAQGFGFHFDQVTLTNVDEQVADAQSDVCAVCGDLVCEGSENQCSCPQDCGTPPGSEAGLCTDGQDNDCDGDVDCDDADCAGDPACPAGPVCGNGTCELGEDCTTCSADCAGQTGGKPSGRFCCGNGIAEGPEGNGTICDGNF